MTGCDTIKENIQPKNTTIKEKSCPTIKPVDLFKIDKLVFYKNKEIKEGFVFFLENLNGTVNCKFIDLKDKELADLLIKYQAKVTLGKETTMNENNIPKNESLYNLLYSNGVDIRTEENLHYSYCTDEEKLIISSKSFNNDETKKDYAMIFTNTELRKVIE